MRWQYKTLKMSTTGFWGGKLDEEKFDAMLNQLGHESWELVACFDTNEAQGNTRDVVAVFKRPAS